MMRCDYCDATMVYHKDGALPTGGLLKCHHCQAQQVLPGKCPSCSRHVTVFGLGTQRVEEEIARKFPRATYSRMDSDTMRSAKDYHTSLQAFGRGEVDLLVGTQMIAKGLDFPNVRLVGVISGDTALHMPDFRAAERTFQLIAQVAGRAGRGDKAGTVVVQTFNPDDPSILLASKHDYESFANREMKLRAEVGLPPATRMARIVCRDTDLVKCVASATELASHLSSANERLGGAVRVRGPMPCPIARVADFHRQQIELIAPDAATLQKLLADLRSAALVRSDAHTAVDVDPVTMI
jgi:primosomal protein N' (replication factor Y)